MGTTIRPELSEKNPYWIERHRYYELKHFCLQYPIWKKAYAALDGLSRRPSDLEVFSKKGEISDPNALNQKKQASLMSAYAMLNESYKQYRKAAKTVYGEDADDKIHAEMAKDAMVSTYDWGYQVYNMDMDSDSERLLFYDLASKKYFRTTMAAVLNAQYHVNRNLSVRGVCPLNEYLSFLGLDEVDGGDVIGWDICYMIEEMDCYWLDFDNHKTTLEDGLECIIIDTMALSKFE